MFGLKEALRFVSSVVVSAVVEGVAVQELRQAVVGQKEENDDVYPFTSHAVENLERTK